MNISPPFSRLKVMINRKFSQYLTRSIAAIMCITLVTSCAYHHSSRGHHSSRHHKSDIATPLIIGAAVIGAVVLAKHHSDRKKELYYDKKAHDRDKARSTRSTHSVQPNKVNTRNNRKNTHSNRRNSGF